MTASLRTALLALALALVSFAMSNGLAGFSWYNFVAMCTALACAMTMPFARERDIAVPAGWDRAAFALAAFVPAVADVYMLWDVDAWLSAFLLIVGTLLAVGFLRRPDAVPLRIDFGLGVIVLATVASSPQVCIALHGEVEPFVTLIPWMAAFGFATIGLAFLIGPFGTKSRLGWVLVGVLFATGFGVRALPLAATPDPLVDVYFWLRDSADWQMKGENPYTHDIGSPYGTERAYAQEIYNLPEARPAAYPPQAFLAAMPFRLLGLDVRWLNVVADMLAAAVLFGVAIRGGRLTPAMALVGLYLHLPRTPLILEQAWFEPLLAGLLGVGLLLRDKGYRLGDFVLGVGLTAKQFGAVMALPLLVAFRGGRVRFVVGVAAAAAVFLLPWYLSSPGDFVDIVFMKHLGRPPQLSSLTVGSALHRLGFTEVPRVWLWATALVLIAVVTWKTPSRPIAAAWGMGTSLLVFSFFHTQGFANYFYLVQYLWLLSLTGGESRDDAPKRK